MAELKFFLLDITYQVIGGEPHVIMWGITEDGERVVVRDARFRPYFYVIPRGGVDPKILSEKIKTLSKPRSPIVKVEEVERRLYGRPKTVLRVETVIPDSVPEYREKINALESVEEVLEADIRFTMRYMIDHNVRPSGWNIAEVVEVEKTPGYIADREFMVKGGIHPLEEGTPPNLRVLAFDIECYNPGGAPNPKKDPVIIISTVNSEGEKLQFTADDKDDERLLREFIEYVKTYDPDVIVGYNSNRFDWPYLLERARKLKVKLSVSRIGGEPSQSVYGHISIIGRANVDLYDFAEEIPEVKVKTLEEVADYLGVMSREERISIEWIEIARYWDDPSLRDRLSKYAMQDAESTMGLAEKFLPFAIQLSNITGIPLDHVGAASVGFRVEWFLMREAFSRGELVPNRRERGYESYKGAIVLEPRKGIHEDVAVLDFTSMYPNIMIKYNVGPDTYVSPEEVKTIDREDYWTAPEVNHKFRKEPPGFFKEVLTKLLDVRRQVRRVMNKFLPGTPEYRVLDERQKALKVLANAMYGYQGWSAARWYCREAAEAITAWGRQTIVKAIDIAKSLGLEVLYGDTDSIFLRGSRESIEEFVKLVEENLGFEIKIDKRYKRVFFTEAKKRYCGLLEDGRIDIVGFEAVRGDWAEIAKEVQEEVISITLREGTPEKAVEYVKNIVEKLRKREIPISKLIIWKSLSKGVREYEVEAPHVAAAKKLVERGIRVGPGDKIGYVIVRGSGKLSERATPYIYASIEEVDEEYYVDRQIIPAAMRVLGYFGVSESALKTLASGKQKSLFEFIG